MNPRIVHLDRTLRCCSPHSLIDCLAKSTYPYHLPVFFSSPTSGEASTSCSIVSCDALREPFLPPPPSSSSFRQVLALAADRWSWIMTERSPVGKSSSRLSVGLGVLPSAGIVTEPVRFPTIPPPSLSIPHSLVGALFK
ncbi:hypothetical protein JAAARDRAFT_646060 [Jaapia argillacea MUCL 33604]|uniref:Uncharacterized protein n=1 Tax=Jaapia argillacea MUCL 33604 TaxID=933084 RepID=A0A067Q5S0_9AGAM|nr:hypothetical protein JAAARDRAFT_646060 [Jaapia argillacea MUCL 33604]